MSYLSRLGLTRFVMHVFGNGAPGFPLARRPRVDCRHRRADHGKHDLQRGRETPGTASTRLGGSCDLLDTEPAWAARHIQKCS